MVGHPQELIRQIADMWNEGKTAKQISAVVGLSRNAVIGIANREKNRGQFVKKPNPTERSGPVRPERSVPPLQEPQEGDLAIGAVYQPIFIRDAPYGVPTAPPRKDYYTLMDLGSRNCKWPVNGGQPYLFCGRSTSDLKRVYCDHHHARGLTATTYKPARVSK